MFTVSRVPSRRPWRSAASVFGSLAMNGLYTKLNSLSTSACDDHKRCSSSYAWACWSGVSVQVTRGGLNDPVCLLIGASQAVTDKYMARQMMRIESENDLISEEDFLIGFDFDEDCVCSLMVEDMDTLDWVVAELAELKHACDSM